MTLDVKDHEVCVSTMLVSATHSLSKLHLKYSLQYLFIGSINGITLSAIKLLFMLFYFYLPF